jgi:zona occludens toxin (predicted ATPase)
VTAAVAATAIGSFSSCVLVLSFVAVTTFSTAAVAAAPATAAAGSAATAAVTAAVAFAATAAVPATGSFSICVHVLSSVTVTTFSAAALRSPWLLEVYLLELF